MSVEVLFPRVRKASPKERYLWQNGPKDAFTEARTCSNRPKDMEFPAGGEVGRCLPSYIRPSFSWSTTSIISVLVWFPQVFLMLLPSPQFLRASWGLCSPAFGRAKHSFLLAVQGNSWIIFNFGTLKLVDPLMLQMMSMLPSCYTGCAVTFCACLKSGSPLFFLFQRFEAQVGVWP